MAERGRPKSEDPANNITSVRLTNSEHQAVKQAADLAGLRLGRYMRAKIVEAAQEDLRSAMRTSKAQSPTFTERIPEHSENDDAATWPTLHPDDVDHYFNQDVYLHSPEIAWKCAIAGVTPEMETNDGEKRMLSIVREIVLDAAANGWWPFRTPDGQYIALGLDEWVAEGHKYSRRLPDIQHVLDRWKP